MATRYIIEITATVRIISKKTKYCLRALYHLSRDYGHGPTLVSTLAQQEEIPKKFLEQILLSLKMSGIVESKPGRGGGYNLSRPPEEITLGAVIRTIEGPLAPLPCASETAYRPCEECVEASVCGTRLIMRRVRDATAKILDETTLRDVCNLSDAARSDLADRLHEDSIL